MKIGLRNFMIYYYNSEPLNYKLTVKSPKVRLEINYSSYKI